MSMPHQIKKIIWVLFLPALLDATTPHDDEALEDEVQLPQSSVKKDFKGDRKPGITNEETAYPQGENAKLYEEVLKKSEVHELEVE